MEERSALALLAAGAERQGELGPGRQVAEETHAALVPERRPGPLRGGPGQLDALRQFEVDREAGARGHGEPEAPDVLGEIHFPLEAEGDAVHPLPLEQEVGAVRIPGQQGGTAVGLGGSEPDPVHRKRHADDPVDEHPDVVLGDEQGAFVVDLAREGPGKDHGGGGGAGARLEPPLLRQTPQVEVLPDVEHDPAAVLLDEGVHLVVRDVDDPAAGRLVPVSIREHRRGRRERGEEEEDQELLHD